jgi:hypothetical protein
MTSVLQIKMRYLPAEKWRVTWVDPTGFATARGHLPEKNRYLARLKTELMTRMVGSEST